MQGINTLIQIIIGGGLFAFVQFLITRHDGKHDKLKGITDEIAALRKDIKAIDEKGDLRDAIATRVRILSFGNELLEGRRHTKDSFDQVESDITAYETYCHDHPEFRNSMTTLTIECINREYSSHLAAHDFPSFKEVTNYADEK